MAAVYKAFQPSMERYVAIKVLPRHLAASPEFVVVRASWLGRALYFMSPSSFLIFSTCNRCSA